MALAHLNEITPPPIDDFRNDPIRPVFFPSFPKCYANNIKNTIEMVFGYKIDLCHWFPQGDIGRNMCVFITFADVEVTDIAIAGKRTWPNGAPLKVEKGVRTELERERQAQEKELAKNKPKYLYKKEEHFGTMIRMSYIRPPGYTDD